MLKVFEGFAGYDSHRLALKNIGADFEVVGISDTQLYKLAGNSIVVPVLEEIFKKLLIKQRKDYEL